MVVPGLGVRNSEACIATPTCPQGRVCYKRSLFRPFCDPARGDHQDKPRCRSDEGVDLKLASGKEGQMVWTHKLPAQNVLSCFVLHYGVR